MTSSYDERDLRVDRGDAWSGRYLPRTRMRDGMESSSDAKDKKSTKNKPFVTALAILLIVVVSLTLVAIAVIITIAALRSEKTTTQYTTDTYSISLTLSSTYEVDLADSSSLKFHQLSETTCNQIKQIYKTSVLQKSYLGCIITSFRQGSVIVSAMLLFDNQADITTKKKPAGSSLSPEEYTVYELLNEGAKKYIPNYVESSTSVSAVDTPANVSRTLDRVAVIERNQNCDEQPCVNGGTCTDGLDTFFCACPSAYTGSTCAQDIAECNETACGGRGECLELVGGGIRCICDTGFTSSNCQTNIDDCIDNPCSYGNCTDLVGNFSCTCEPGYTGKRCDTEMNPAINCTNHPPCGDATITRGVVLSSYVEGQSVQYTCASGYRIVGSNDNTNNSANVFCERDGKWTTTPSCEPVNCGVPVNGTNTEPVLSSGVVYPGTYTYSCITDYESADSLQSACQPDGTWSLNPPPTCTAVLCNGSQLLDLANAVFTSEDVAVGGTVTYSCNPDYRLAPTYPSSVDQNQTVTCQSDGSFSPLLYTCVYTLPTDCRDYYTRDNLFAAAATTCTAVATDQDGPDIANGNETVQCCKDSASTFCTRISPNTGATYSTPAGECTGTGPNTVLPNTEFPGTLSKLCDVPTEVTYGASMGHIEHVISSSAGTCSQRMQVNCPAADSMSVAVRMSGQPSGFLYGTSIFQSAGASPLMNVSNNAYTNAVCDCALGNSPVDTSAMGDCASGCVCTTVGQVPSLGMDTITKHLTADRPSYITSYQVTQHNTPQPAGLGASDIVILLGGITCCETY